MFRYVIQIERQIEAYTNVWLEKELAISINNLFKFNTNEIFVIVNKFISWYL